MSQYIKLTNKTANHNSLQMVEGLNVDPVPFCPKFGCVPGGIYFTTPEYLCSWLTYRDDLELVWEVEIPEDAQVYHKVDKSKADKLILKNPTTIEKYIIQSKLPISNYVLDWATFKGNLNLFKYAHDYINNPNSCPWAPSICSLAAAKGHLEILKFAHENGYPWSKETSMLAACNGYLDCLRYAHKNGCPWNQEEACFWAAKNGHLNCLKYVHDHMSEPLGECPWNQKICEIAAFYNRLDCLRYAHKNGCHWSQKIYERVALHGNSDCLQYMQDHINDRR